MLRTKMDAVNNGNYVVINDRDEFVDFNDGHYINEEDQKDKNK